jgi:RHS repeat-associated protein
MLLPGRHGAVDSYRYGFQGQEMDNEIKGEGNSLNFSFRMYDSRLGRFFALDPLDYKYPHYTPYSFAGNKVISYKELEGLEEEDAVGRFYGALIEMTKTKLAMMNDDDKARDPLHSVKVQLVNFIGRVHSDGLTPEEAHFVLDAMGAIPVIGEPIDAIHGIIYAVNGDYANAGISFVAVIPIYGDTGKIAKYSMKAIDVFTVAGRTFNSSKAAARYNKIITKFDGSRKVADAIWDSGGKKMGVRVGNNKLAKKLKTAGTGEQAHHIIPVELIKNNETVKEAIEQGFDFNGKINGIGLGPKQHLGSHGDYTRGVEELINAARSADPKATAREVLESVSTQLKSDIGKIKDTDTKINNVFNE